MYTVIEISSAWLAGVCVCVCKCTWQHCNTLNLANSHLDSSLEYPLGKPPLHFTNSLTFSHTQSNTLSPKYCHLVWFWVTHVYIKDGRGGLQSLSLQLNDSCIAYHLCIGCTYTCIATGVIVYASMAGSTLWDLP